MMKRIINKNKLRTACFEKDAKIAPCENNRAGFKNLYYRWLYNCIKII